MRVTKEVPRAPESQKAHIVEKPLNPEHIGGSVTIEINEKKLSVPFGHYNP